MVLDHPYPSDLRVENEARTLRAAGHEVRLLQMAPDTRPVVGEHEGTVIVRHRLPARLRNALRGTSGMIPAMDLYLARLIRRLHRTWAFDALHIHDLYLVGGGLRAGEKLGVPVVADLHENWVEALQHYAWSTRSPGRWIVRIPKWERVERAWTQAADRVVVPIEEAATRYAGMGVDPQRIAVVPNTVSLTEYDATPVDQTIVDALASPLTLVYTGGIDAHRGLETVVDAMPAVLAQERGARLVVVGDGRTLKSLRERAAPLGDRVTFKGWQPQHQIKSYMVAADLALIPHLKTPHTDNTIPHKLFHAMAVGTPVVVSNCDPLERIVGSEECGVVFRSGDPASFADAVGRMRDPAARAAMGERGRVAVRARYNWDATAGPLVELYEGLGRDGGGG